MPSIERYADFVEHPRYGRGPRFTGLNPQTSFFSRTHLHGHSPKSCRIANTAIAADINKQVPATIHVTHYYDVEYKCRDCDRMFIFFALEQKYWYETLQFGLDSGCVRCVPCRNIQQGLEAARRKYEELFHYEERTDDQSLMMAECCLELIENAVFTSKQTERVRMLLNSVGDDTAHQDRMKKIRKRVLDIEADGEE